MEKKNPKDCSKNINSSSFLKNNLKKIPHPKSKNLKYYPISTNVSYQGYPTIYLVAEDNNKKNISNIKHNKYLTCQKSTDFLFHKDKCQNNNLTNIKEQFNSTTNNINNISNYESKNNLIHSYSVDNYFNLSNKSFDILGANLKLLENSKIMDKKFINGIRDLKRKNNLLNALKMYNIYKSFGKKEKNKVVYSPKNQGKKIEKYNRYNIIMEEENENCENDYKKNYNSRENLLKNNTYKEIFYNKNINDKQICIQVPKNEKKSIYSKINNNKKTIIKNTNDNLALSNKGSKTINNVESKRNYQSHQMNDKETKKYIKKPIQNETKKIYKRNDINQNKSFKLNINNNINNNNINLNRNNNDSKAFKEVLVRKIMTEEKYIIDENGQEKVLEINRSIIGNDKLHNYNINKNNKYLPKREINQDKKPKIIIINDNKDKHMIKGYYRNDNISPANNYLIKSRTAYNSSQKDNNNKKINRIIRSNKNNNNKELNNIYDMTNNHSIVYSNHQNRNNNIKSNRILNMTQTSPNQVRPFYEISLITNNININNHIYHEIKKINEKKNKKDSKTIYHDYANSGRKIILNNSYKNLGFVSDNKIRLNKKIINKSQTKNYIQIPKDLVNDKNRNYYNIKFKNANITNNSQVEIKNNNNSKYNINRRFNNYIKRKEN